MDSNKPIKFVFKEYCTTNYRVFTKNGSPVRILCTDRASDDETNAPIVALVKNLETGLDMVFWYRMDGKCFQYPDEEKYDLYLVPKSIVGYINIFAHYNPIYPPIQSSIFTDYDSAMRDRDNYLEWHKERYYIDTIEFSYEPKIFNTIDLNKNDGKDREKTDETC